MALQTGKFANYKAGGHDGAISVGDAVCILNLGRRERINISIISISYQGLPNFYIGTVCWLGVVLLSSSSYPSSAMPTTLSTNIANTIHTTTTMRKQQQRETINGDPIFRPCPPLGGSGNQVVVGGGGGDTGTGDLFTFAHAQRRRCCCCPVLGEPRREHCLPLSIDSLNCSVIHRTVFVCLQRKGEVKERWMGGWMAPEETGRKQR